MVINETVLSFVSLVSNKLIFRITCIAMKVDSIVCGEIDFTYDREFSGVMNLWKEYSFLCNVVGIF